MAGEVTVDDQMMDKPGRRVPATATLQVKTPLPYVSRGGVKLAAALDAFVLDVLARARNAGDGATSPLCRSKRRRPRRLIDGRSVAWRRN
jgi:23S rRNA (cytidine1920-2'-O)/16S rRNA (cytidine1409-2'-O)-methyltransferase